MKKKLVIGTLGAALVFGGAFAVGAANNEAVKPTATVSTEKTLLSIDEVEKIALQKVNGVVESIELEKERGKTVYEIDIEKDNIDYDLHIDAYSGEVYSVTTDDDDFDDDGYHISHSKLISQAKAVAIAEKEVNGKMVEVDRDEDDGRIKYDIELKTSNGEAEVEIDASTGKVLEVEWED
jgi:uncharacterized membrane protein YkoI